MARYRKQRVSEMLKEFLSAELLRSHNELLRLVSISAIEMSPDLNYAKIYWVPSQAALLVDQSSDSSTAQPPSAEKIIKSMTEALKDSRKELRTSVARGMNLRHAPELEFRYDESIERGSRIDELLSKVGL